MGRSCLDSKGGDGGGDGSLLNIPAIMLVYLRHGSAETIELAVTLRQKLQIKLSLSSCHSILTPDEPVPASTL